jgi:cellulose synthase/poly-beta-1,6-N-acetylglucosamine synthase-like glycosyltransferase
MQLIWVLFTYLKLALHRETAKGSTPEVSVIITARNEEDNLFQLLPFILNQNYPRFEVIVVNFQSTDDSTHILKALQREHTHLKVIEIQRNKHLSNGKKLPITAAVKGAKYDHLLFTDADCKPSSKNWIRGMAGCFSSKKQIIIGYSPVKKVNTFSNWLIRLDATFSAMNSISTAKAGMPFTAEGRNMGYTKHVFSEVNGFKSHYSIQPGEDDLFVQQAAKKGNYTICLNNEAFSVLDSEPSWKEWLQIQSIKHSTRERYSLIKKVLLGIYPLSLVFMYLSFITLLMISKVNGLNMIIIGTILLLKWIIFGVILSRIKEKQFIAGVLIWDVLYAIAAPILYYSPDHSTRSSWK